MCVLISSTTSVRKISHSKMSSYMYTGPPAQSTRHSCQTLMELEFPQQIFFLTFWHRNYFFNFSTPCI